MARTASVTITNFTTSTIIVRAGIRIAAGKTAIFNRSLQDIDDLVPRLEQLQVAGKISYVLEDNRPRVVSQDIITYGTGLAIAAGATAQAGGISFIRGANTIPSILVWTGTVPTGATNYWVPTALSPFAATEVSQLFAYFARGAGQPGNQYAGLIENRWSTNDVDKNIPIVVDWMIVVWRIPS